MMRRSCVGLFLAVVFSIYIVEYCLITRNYDRRHWQESLGKRRVKFAPSKVKSNAELPNEYFHYDAKLQEPLSDKLSLAEFLYKEVRVLCWIPITAEKHFQNARTIKNTWGKRCHKLIFFSTEANQDLGAIKLTSENGYYNLWDKTKMALSYIYTHHINDADWFFKADGDTYAIMENLRYMLYPYATDTPIHFGFKFKFKTIKSGYMSGGAGYILSREALTRFIEVALPNRTICSPKERGTEDLELGRCLQNINVVSGDTRDMYGRFTFFPLRPVSLVVYGEIEPDFWLYKNSFYNLSQGVACCSNYAVSFHYVTPHVMYAYEFILYLNRPFGIEYGPDILPRKLKVGDAKSPWIHRIITDTNNSDTLNSNF